jgi:hypothetical protein
VIWAYGYLLAGGLLTLMVTRRHPLNLTEHLTGILLWPILLVLAVIQVLRGKHS